MITSYILQLKVVEFKAFIHDKVDNDSTYFDVFFDTTMAQLFKRVLFPL